MKYSYLLVLISFIAITSCNTVYQSPDMNDLAKNHKIVAILPPSVEFKEYIGKDIPQKLTTERIFSNNWQKEIENKIIIRKAKELFFVDVLDVDSTNILLSNAGYPLKSFSSSELCSLLGVDAIIGSQFEVDIPRVTYEAGYGKTFINVLTVSMFIQDGQTGKIIWQYKSKFAGGIGENITIVVSKALKSIYRKFPYNTAKGKTYQF